MIGQVYALYLGQDADTVPAVKHFDTYAKKVNPSWVPDLYTLFGWASAELFVQALKAAGPHPTRGAVIAQLKKITSFNANGLMAGSDPGGQEAVGLLRHGQYQERHIRPRVCRQAAGFDCNTKFYDASGVTG